MTEETLAETEAAIVARVVTSSADLQFTFTPDLLAALRREGMAGEQVNMLAARVTINLDSLMEEVGRDELALSDALGMATVAAYFAEQDRAFTAYFGDLANWKPTGILGHLPAPAPSPERNDL